MFTKAHQHHIHKIEHMKDKLGGLYIHLVIQALAASMVSIFVPIHLLEHGISWSNVFIFLLIQWSVFALSSPFCAQIIQKYGLKEVIVIRTPIFIIGLVILSGLGEFAFIQNLLWFAAFCLGFSANLYTISISTLFSDFMHKKSEGTETGKMMSFPKLGTVIGPAIGAFIATQFGFGVLFVLVSAILFLSVLPLSGISHKLDHPKFSMKELFHVVKKYKKMAFYLNMYGIKTFVFFVVVPLVLYVKSSSVTNLGLLMSAISLINVLITFFLGKMSDKIGIKRILLLGSMMTALFFIGLALYSGNPMFVYVSLFSGIINVLIDLPFETELYDHAKRENTHVAFIVFKEISLIMGRAILFILLIYLGSSLFYSFYLGAGSALVFLFY